MQVEQNRELVYQALSQAGVTFQRLGQDTGRTMYPQACFAPKVKRFSIQGSKVVQSQLVSVDAYDNYFTRVEVGKQRNNKPKYVTKFLPPTGFRVGNIEDFLVCYMRGDFSESELREGIISAATYERHVEMVHVPFAKWITMVPCFKKSGTLSLEWLCFNHVRAEKVLLVS